jgi:hypothetical protein
MFLGSDSRGLQKASETVIESPNAANVPGVPVKRAWTFRIGSIQDGVEPSSAHTLALGKSIAASSESAMILGDNLMAWFSV